jgi:hypothetical protein
MPAKLKQPQMPTLLAGLLVPSRCCSITELELKMLALRRETLVARVRSVSQMNSPAPESILESMKPTRNSHLLSVLIAAHLSLRAQVKRTPMS